MWKEDEMEKNQDYIKKTFIIGLILGLIVVFTGVIRAEDNETKKVVLKEWSTQLLYDTTNVCYQGTIRWIVMTNPTLLGQSPGWRSQRQMLEHCFCVMDRIRKEITIKEYQKKVYDEEWTGTTFMTKALECVKIEKTLPSFFVIQGDRGIKTAPTPKEVVPNGETEDSKEESPDQKQEESEVSPQTIFQG